MLVTMQRKTIEWTFLIPQKEISDILPLWSVSLRSSLPYSTSSFLKYFPLCGTITYKMDIALYSRSLEPRLWEHKTIMDILTVATNQVKSTHERSELQSDVTQVPQTSPPAGRHKKCSLKPSPLDVFILYKEYTALSALVLIFKHLQLITAGVALPA